VYRSPRSKPRPYLHLVPSVALPVTIGSVRYPGIQIHDTRIIRLLEVLLHGSTTVTAVPRTLEGLRASSSVY
jgi:hypothetical protein